jgi:hypothetical protein
MFIVRFCKRFFAAVAAQAKSRINISKIILISSVSFISKYLINTYLGINVFTEYLNWISIIYYLGLATFIVLINEFFSIYKISIIPNFTWFSRIISKIRKKFR